MRNVVIIGSGIAGLSCAVALAEAGIASTLVSPHPSERAQSVMAAGGINAAGCSKSLSCMDVCPMQIPTLSSIAKLNRTKPGKELR